MWLTIPPPPVQGLGSAGGPESMVQDRAGLGSDALSKVVQTWSWPPSMDLGLRRRGHTVRYVLALGLCRYRPREGKKGRVDADRRLQYVWRSISGSQYVNDFNYILGLTYQVIAQADGSFRQDPQDIARLKARNASGEMVPIGTVAQLKSVKSAYGVPSSRYDLFPSAEVMGVAAPGVATGTALHRMEELAREVLPPGIGFEWTELAIQQQQKGVFFVAGVRRLPRCSCSSCWPRSMRAGTCRWRW